MGLSQILCPDPIITCPCALVHSDQGSQYTSHDWSEFLREHGLEGSMSRRGNCHDNAVAESFFQLLKRERIKRKIYATRDAARSDIFDYIEMFYNTKRQHGSNNGLSPVDYERQYLKEAEKRLVNQWRFTNHWLSNLPSRRALLFEQLLSSTRLLSPYCGRLDRMYLMRQYCFLL